MPQNHALMIDIKKDPLLDGNVVDLLNKHRRQMLKHSPPDSVHALRPEQLREPNIEFWSAYWEDEFAGCGALKRLDSTHAEIKSMKTRDTFLRKGIAKALLVHLIEQAKSKGFARISLETGTMAVFEPARTLYKKLGFVECEPFSNYIKDPLSVCMTLKLT